MKINFALVGLAAAQSGEGKDYEYDYPAASEDRWEFSNGVTFTDFNGKTTNDFTASDYNKALKLSCWNSNMVRDMNNDSKFSRYQFQSGGRLEGSETNWHYAKGDLTTGMNHQLGFESTVVNEFAGNKNTDSIEAGDTTYGIRPSNTDFTKWGYNSNGVNRAVSDGYDLNTVAYHFGHADNRDNTANRPYGYNVDGNNMNLDFNGFKDDWRFSLRMGGCLYEANEWIYDENSFAKTGRLTYTGDSQFYANIFDNGNGYPSSGSYFADVHWVHVFNAHVFPYRPTGYRQNTANDNDSITAADGQAKRNFQKTQRDIEDFNVVMANPTYEGHGFLNFVATYHDHVDPSQMNGDQPYSGYRFWSTINGYNNVDASGNNAICADLRGDRVNGGGRANDERCGSAIYENFGDWYFRPAQTYNYNGAQQENYWAFVMPLGFSGSSDLWKPDASGNGVDDDGSGEARGFAISSFPHNELGQDFRFNIRTLHNMGLGVAKTKQVTTNKNRPVVNSGDAVWSYYFYAVDTIKIVFPDYVARVNHCHLKSHQAHPNCASNGDGSMRNDHSGWSKIIIDGTTMKNRGTSNDSRYTDANSQYGFTSQLEDDDPTRASLSYFDSTVKSFDSELETSSQKGFTYCNGQKRPTDINFTATQGLTESGRPYKPCASWCHPTGYSGPQICGRILTISGLTETYDELHLRQYGTIQEVWVQLMYAFIESFDEPGGRLTTARPSRGVESPFPNVFFSAPEVLGITATCDNSYKCNGYLSDENQPYGGAREGTNRVYDNRGAYTSPGVGSNDYHADSMWPSNDTPV